MSPVELMVLASVPEEFVNANEIVLKLVNSTNEWRPTAGTLYPVLHRLERVGFLEKTKGRHINFRRTPKGSFFMGSILNPLILQIQDLSAYFYSIHNQNEKAY